MKSYETVFVSVAQMGGALSDAFSTENIYFLWKNRIKRTNAQSFVTFTAVTASLFCGRPHICRLCHMPAGTEEHPPNFRFSLLLVIL